MDFLTVVNIQYYKRRLKQTTQATCTACTAVVFRSSESYNLFWIDHHLLSTTEELHQLDWYQIFQFLTDSVSDWLTAWPTSLQCTSISACENPTCFQSLDKIEEFELKERKEYFGMNEWVTWLRTKKAAISLLTIPNTFPLYLIQKGAHQSRCIACLSNILER